ncbi:MULTISPECIES: SusC/RagA family TonB-linked outer membrane protein [Sphingobacterium]|uniref:TonB-dependent receptor n=1 Tax=Sphingobacterium litopenaei TaxID=2763500 RepID=A0ABR7YEA5_9SPHI|nr:MULTISPECIES: TonB-dependent receptor [Sphingobacterium]MBD1429640.1 TonB-dependent receptor [Sphingobacterium litopenaei]NGM73042.1 TonB-dependent receptor [Sphingobacterium sp. SGL-16]
MNKFLLTCFLLLSVISLTLAQEIVEVTGIVLDAQKNPLPGVTVHVLDAPGLGTITDNKGQYKIKAERYKKLVFRSVGYKTQEILIKDDFKINITLLEDESNVLEEVVVTGMGNQTKLTLTGAVTTVNVDDLKSNPTSSITNALAGNVAGVMAMMQSGQPGRNISEFWIRGISTFGGGTSALVLVDNIERNINDINIEDIESISVLKDAAVTAIYGSKGANGVILITTKRGKEGKINISVKSETIYNTRTITPEFEDGFTYAKLLNEARITRNFEPVYQPEELEILRLGLDPDLYPNVDWQDKLLNDGAMTYRANLNMSGGGSTARYFVSGSYIEEGGMYKIDENLKKDYNTNANYKRWNYRLNTDMNITKTTILKVGVAGALGKRNSPGLGDGDFWGALFGYSPINYPITYSNGRIPAAGEGNKTNPWVMATQSGYNENWTNNIQIDINVEQNLDFITRGLRGRGIIGYDTWNNNNIRRLKWPEQWRADRARNVNTGEIIFYKVSDPREMYQESSASGNRREFLDFMFNYDRGFNGHNVGAVARFTRDALVQTVNLGNDIKNGIARRNEALAGRLTYNFRNRYFTDFNFGYTGSENFSRGNQYGFFPAVSFAWNISEEKIFKENADWMDLLKVRFSYGKTGNDQLMGGERFPYLYNISTAGGYQWADFGSDRGYGGLRYSQVASPYVSWEVSIKKNLGFDINLFKNKFESSIELFDEKRTDIYMPRNFLPEIVGLESIPRANVGEVSSKGFEGRFSYRQKIGEVNITARGNVTYSKNKIIERDEENNVYPYQNSEGFRVDQAKGLIALGLFKDYEDIRNSPTQTFGVYQPGDIKYKDVNGDGVVDNGDIVAIGATRRPNLIYGLGSSFQWKGIDINLHIQGAGKSTFSTYGKTVYVFSEGEWGQVMKGIMGDNRWISADISGDPSTEDPNASYPRLSYGSNPNNFRESTYWLRNGKYLRLKNIDIGYSLPKSLTNRIRTNNIRLFLAGHNLLTWSEFKLWDPELATPRGEDYPLPKSVTFGVNINL